jgi:hypothetical protein
MPLRTSAAASPGTRRGSAALALSLGDALAPERAALLATEAADIMECAADTIDASLGCSDAVTVSTPDMGDAVNVLKETVPW